MKFLPMLASKLEDVKGNLNFPLYISPKLDGIRVVVQDGQPITRSGKLIPNKSIQQWFEVFGRELEGLDGELIVGEPFGEDVFKRSTSGIMSQDGEPDFCFYVFDLFNDKSFANRYEAYKNRVEAFNMPIRVKVVRQSIVNSIDEVNSINADFVANGYEGSMLKNPNGFYKQGRATAKSQDLLKVKSFSDAEAYVVGFEEQMQNTNELKRDGNGDINRSNAKSGLVPKDTLGSLIVCGAPGSEYGNVEFSIGTGFTEAERQAIWDARDSYVGQMVKFKYFPSQQDKPRFPVFLGWRDLSDL